MLLMLYAKFRMRMGHYTGILTSHVNSYICLQICAVPTADAVATGKVNWYNSFTLLTSMVCGDVQPGVL